MSFHQVRSKYRINTFGIPGLNALGRNLNLFAFLGSRSEATYDGTSTVYKNSVIAIVKMLSMAT